MIKNLIKTESGQKINFTLNSARMLVITGVCDQVWEEKKDKEITQINFNNELTFSVNDNIPVGKTYFKVRKIKRIKREGVVFAYSFYYDEINQSYLFILPMLGPNKEYFFWDSLLVNSYVKTYREDDSKYIHLLYRFSASSDFGMFEERLIKHKYFKESKDVDRYHILYTFEIPEEYQKDYELFLQGKYSKFSYNYKKHLMVFHRAQRGKFLHQVIMREPARKEQIEKELGVELSADAELHSPPDIEKETYKEDMKIILPLK